MAERWKRHRRQRSIGTIGDQAVDAPAHQPPHVGFLD